MNVLALETATAACSVALLTPHGVHEIHEIAPRRHTELLLGMVERVLTMGDIARAAVDLVAFGAGPGTFTGVRVAAAVAQGLALARDLPVAPVSTLAALAAGGARLHGARQVVAALDARRDEVYLAALRFASPQATGESVVAECVMSPADIVLAEPADWFAVGNGWDIYAAQLPRDIAAMPRGTPLHPHAQDVARLGLALHAGGASVAACDAHPVYLRGALD